MDQYKDMTISHPSNFGFLNTFVQIKSGHNPVEKSSEILDIF